jgi:hypothetical protein
METSSIVEDFPFGVVLEKAEIFWIIWFRNYNTDAAADKVYF